MPTAPKPVTAGVARVEIDALEVLLGPRRLRLIAPCQLTAGRLYLVLGPSGSGKSSFARALLGFGELSEPAIPCHGRVTIVDAAGRRQPLWNDSEYHPAARTTMAFLPQAERLGFLDGMPVRDNLALFSHLTGVQANEEIERLAGTFHLQPLPERLATASGGERIRLSAIRGLIPREAVGHLPALVIVDEPTAGLDRVSARSMARSLAELARSEQTVVMVITHEPELFVDETIPDSDSSDNSVRIIGCALNGDEDNRAETVGALHLEEIRATIGAIDRVRGRVVESLDRLGAVALSPLAFLIGLLRMHRPRLLAGQVARDAGGIGTQAFSLTGCLLMAGTVAYFIFERMPKPELVEPLLLPELMAVTGHTLVRMVLPVGACGLVATKLGAAQAARLAAAVRGGLLETLALAGWRVEAYALVPAVIAQCLAMTLATIIAVATGVVLAAVVYVAGHDGASLPLTLALLVDGLRQSPHWWMYAAAKIVISGFLVGAIAALYGTAPTRAEDDVARAVHRTLLWSVLAVIASQCALVLVEFAR